MLTHEEYIAIKGHSWDMIILSLPRDSVNTLARSNGHKMVTNSNEKPLFYGGLQVLNLTKH